MMIIILKKRIRLIKRSIFSASSAEMAATTKSILALTTIIVIPINDPFFLSLILKILYILENVRFDITFNSFNHFVACHPDGHLYCAANFVQYKLKLNVIDDSIQPQCEPISISEPCPESESRPIFEWAQCLSIRLFGDARAHIPRFYLRGMEVRISPSLFYLWIADETTLAAAYCRGYRARRLLRARIDEAISRGVYIPGYTGDDYPTYGRGVRARLPMLPQPTVYEDWIDIKSEGGTDKKVVPGWDIKVCSISVYPSFRLCILVINKANKFPLCLVAFNLSNSIRYDCNQPTAIAAILPYVPPSTTNVPLSNATSLLHQLLDPLREYWFVRAPDGAEPGQVQGLANRGSRAATVDSPNPAPANNEEKEIDLTDAEGLSVAVLIAMPNPSQPSIEAYGKGKSVSRPSSYQHGAGVASTSQLRQSVSLDGGVVEEQAKEDLPELMMGVAEVGIQIPKEPTPEPRTGEGNIGGRSISVPTETNPKVVSPNPLERIKSNSMPQ